MAKARAIWKGKEDRHVQVCMHTYTNTHSLTLSGTHMLIRKFPSKVHTSFFFFNLGYLFIPEMQKSFLTIFGILTVLHFVYIQLIDYTRNLLGESVIFNKHCSSRCWVKVKVGIVQSSLKWHSCRTSKCTFFVPVLFLSLASLLSHLF